MPTTTAVHVNGEAKLRYSTTSTGILTSTGSLSDLGVSMDTTDIEFIDYTDAVIADTTGPYIPFDEQQFGEIAIIRTRLVVYDATALSNIRARAAIKQSGAEGTVGATGFLWGANAMYFRLLIVSADANEVFTAAWNFPKARLRNSFPVKLGTRRSQWDLEFIAYPAFPSATIAVAYAGNLGSQAGNILYNNIAT